ncbi:MAG TPA: polyprenyl synthetase family protein [Spirillospora sp.]|nr:polyprenyl synthetase family protein [Spirillospora sp.]
MSTLSEYMEECRALVIAEIEQFVPHNRYRPILYDLMLEYPRRAGKALRPSLCIATCRAMGGRLQDVLRTAAVLELFHNAFLIHDDIEDGSLMRRGLPTLHRDYGVSIAINVGDGIFALCLQPLLDNMEELGIGKALRILELISRMVRESVEGQAIELDWIRHQRYDLRDRDYCLMAYKKTCWYTFVAPMLISGTIVGATPAQMARLRKYAAYTGVAFQIQDDLLNLVGDERHYGKESCGDLWEGKYTLMLLHMLRQAAPHERQRCVRILQQPREAKTEADVGYLYHLICRYGSIDYAREVARHLACKARHDFEKTTTFIEPSVHRDFLAAMAGHVIERVH